MDRLRLLARLLPSTYPSISSTQLSTSCNIFPHSQTVLNGRVCKSRISSQSIRQFWGSPRYLQEEQPSAPQNEEQSSGPRGAPQSTSSRPSNPSRTSYKSDWEGLRNIIEDTGRDSTARPTVKSAIDDLFSEPSNRSLNLARGVINSIQSADQTKTTDLESQVRLRLKPSLGRTRPVQEHAGFDLQSAIAVLEYSCRANNVRVDERQQKVHVRRGQRKKNLRMSRWRKMFKEGFKEEVGRVQRMRMQGW